MPVKYDIQIPNQASAHALHSFLKRNDYFPAGATEFSLHFHPRFVYLQPFSLALLAAWGHYWGQMHVPIHCTTLKSAGVDYAWRMGLFQALGVDYQPERQVHEEAGRFIPLRRIDRGADVQTFLADVAPLLHRPEHIQAVQYCLSELIRNVLEHAGGTPAFACAQYYQGPRRVSIGVADCGVGLLTSLNRAHTFGSHSEAIIEALRPGVSGALPRMYGRPDNAGVGLFFTKSIAKASREYFAIVSGDAAFRLRRGRSAEPFRLYADPNRDRHDLYNNFPEWQGTVVAVDIGVRRARSFDATMRTIRTAIANERPGRVLQNVRFV